MSFATANNMRVQGKLVDLDQPMLIIRRRGRPNLVQNAEDERRTKSFIEELSANTASQRMLIEDVVGAATCKNPGGLGVKKKLPTCSKCGEKGHKVNQCAVIHAELYDPLDADFVLQVPYSSMACDPVDDGQIEDGVEDEVADDDMSDLQLLLHETKERRLSDVIIKAEAAQAMKTRMDTGIRVNPDLVKVHGLEQNSTSGSNKLLNDLADSSSSATTHFIEVGYPMVSKWKKRDASKNGKNRLSSNVQRSDEATAVYNSIESLKAGVDIQPSKLNCGHAGRGLFSLIDYNSGQYLTTYEGKMYASKTSLRHVFPQ